MSKTGNKDNLFSLNCIYSGLHKRTILVAICKKEKKSYI